MIALLRRIRRNHALEHATIELLNRRYPRAQIIGFSGPVGFKLYTSLSSKEVVPVVMQALKLLQAGRQELRVHANCGTNLVATATLTTLAATVGLHLGGRPRTFLKRLERFPQAVLLSTLALVFARPVGVWLQRHVTTEANLEDSEIVAIFNDYGYGFHRFQVRTRHAV